ncbi:T9SS type A sorting domain-containing protein [bacterium]|nr:T9SS type A sorting domain-containing protein [bacterium]
MNKFPLSGWLLIMFILLLQTSTAQVLTYGVDDTYHRIWVTDTFDNEFRYIKKYDFGDGTDDNYYRDVYYHTYNKPGNYEVCLFINDTAYPDQIYVDTFCTTINIKGGRGGIKNPEHRLSFMWQYDSLYSNKVMFYSNDSDHSESDKYLLGDAATLSGDTVVYTYPNVNSTLFYNSAREIIDTSSSEFENLKVQMTRVIVRTSYNNDADCEAQFEILVDSTDSKRIALENISTGRNTSTMYQWSYGKPFIPSKTQDLESSERTPSTEYLDYGTYEVCLTIWDDTTHCIDNYCGEVNFDSTQFSLVPPKLEIFDFAQLQTAGVNEIQELELSIYPNPAQDQIFLNNAALIGENIEFYSLSGKTVLSETVPSSLTISLNQLSPGVYLVKVISGNKNYVSRLIIR